MQFKNPAFLYFLFLLLVPILVHLFQLQKFKKVVFTNVAFLQKISKQTRKSSVLKKWLVLATRLLLFLALVFSFSQPYFPSENSLKKGAEHWVYLDNSISLNSKGKKGDLLQNISRDILENVSDDSRISLLTNNQLHKKVEKEALSSIVRNIPYSPNSKKISEILLEIQLKSKGKKNLDKVFLVSDFQNAKSKEFIDVNTRFSLLSYHPETKNNVSIDSLKVKQQTSDLVTLQIYITNHSNKKETLPFSLFINKKLDNKQSVLIQKNEVKSVEFTFQKSPYILGEIQLDFQDTFLFDNRFYFSLDFRSKIKVLSIGKEAAYLSKIYNSNEFDFTSSLISNLDYNQIPNQQFIILNELDTIPATLQRSLQQFLDKGGSLLIIPAKEPDYLSYNQFFREFKLGNIQKSLADSLQITKIDFNHPIFTDVFSKRVDNFEYPTLYTRLIHTFKGNSILRFSNTGSFLEELPLANGKIFWFCGAINSKNSNFTRSPLIVPTLYNLAYQNVAVPKPYYFAGTTFDVAVPSQLKKDEILTITKDGKQFIPMQQSQFSKVLVSLKDNVAKSGFYSVTKNRDTLQHIAVNYHPLESNHNYLNVNKLAKENQNIELAGSINDFFKEMDQKNKVTSLWKLFLAIAIVSLLLEIFILKFFKI